MWTKLLSAFLGAPAEHIAEYFKEKQKLKQELKLAKLRGKVQIQKAKDERAAQNLAADRDWESQQIANSGWKDEWVLILLSIPMIGSFIPGIQLYILEGFNVLEKTPDWYRWIIVTIMLAIYGIRVWRRKSD